jgi:hypothetical protein
MEVLATTPITRRALLVGKAGGLVTGVAALGAVLWACTILSSLLFGLNIGLLDSLNGVMATTLLGIEFGLISLAAGAATGRRGPGGWHCIRTRRGLLRAVRGRATARLAQAVPEAFTLLPGDLRRAVGTVAADDGGRDARRRPGAFLLRPSRSLTVATSCCRRFVRKMIWAAGGALVELANGDDFKVNTRSIQPGPIMPSVSSGTSAAPEATINTS